MTDYIEAFKDEGHIYHREAKRLRAQLLNGNECYVSKDVLRWKSNDRIPPIEICRFAKWLGKNFSIVECDRVREEETAELLASYRANPPVLTDEDKFEMRAAFGAGATVVNVITGEKFKT